MDGINSTLPLLVVDKSKVATANKTNLCTKISRASSLRSEEEAEDGKKENILVVLAHQERCFYPKP
jgi:hypothetical protein